MVLSSMQFRLTMSDWQINCAGGGNRQVFKKLKSAETFNKGSPLDEISTQSMGLELRLGIREGTQLAKRE